jgi:hypothetical protein
LVDEWGEQPATFRLIGDHRGNRRQIGHYAVLEMECEVRFRAQICQPVSATWCRDPTQVDGISNPIENDFDPSGTSRTPACCGDVDRAIVHGCGWTDCQRLADIVTPHEAL